MVTQGFLGSPGLNNPKAHLSLNSKLQEPPEPGSQLWESFGVETNLTLVYPCLKTKISQVWLIESLLNITWLLFKCAQFFSEVAQTAFWTFWVELKPLSAL